MRFSKTIRLCILGFVLYTITGFFLLPFILQSQVPIIINKQINNELELSNITFNPYTLKLQLFDINIHNKTESILYVKKVIIDFSLLKSIHERHISFKEVSLIDPLINIIENKQKRINILSFLKKEKTTTNKEEKQEALIPFKITKTSIINAKINFTHFKNKKKEILKLKKLNYTFYDLGTFKNSLASHSFNTILNTNTKIKINGGFNLEPFRMYGNVKIKNFKPKEFLSLGKEKINFDISNTSINLNFGYELDLRKELKISINNANLHINKLSTYLNNKEIMSFKSFDIKNFNLEYPKENISIDKIIVDTLFLDIDKDKENTLNIRKLLKQTVSSTDKNNEEKFLWKIQTKEIKLLDNKILYKDLKEKISIKLNKLNINIINTSFNDNTLIIEDLDLFNEDFLLNTKKNKVTMSSLSLRIHNLKKLNDEISIPSIFITNKDLMLIDNKNTIKATKMKINISDINMLNNNIVIKRINFQNKKLHLLLENKRLDILNKDLNLFINKVSYKNDYFKIHNSYILKPYTKIILRKTEVKKKETTKKSTKKNITTASSLKFDIGPFKIKDAQVIFEDHNLLVPFKTNITKLQGNISELSSSSSRPTKIKLIGEIDKYGYTDITGFLEYKDIKELVNMNLVFKNLAINNLSPYSSEFIGREILGGKLSLNLKYNIKKSNLDATNSILISKIKLGKIIERKEATSLPLDLGIALLEDSEGLIDLNLQITGNLEDPNFSLGPIVWKVFTNLIVNAVTSPFSFLASLIGLEGDELKNVSFSYGKSIIHPYTKEKLDSLVKIFKKRPNIVLLIKSSYDKEKDSYALRKDTFDLFLDKELKESNAKDRYKDVLENLYEDIFDNIEILRERYTKDGNLDKETYLEEVKKELILKQELPLKELEDLARNRVNAIISYLNNKGIQNKRIQIEDEILKVSKEDSLKQKELLINFNIDILE